MKSNMAANSMAILYFLKLFSHQKYGLAPHGDMNDVICPSCVISCQILVYKKPCFTTCSNQEKYYHTFNYQYHSDQESWDLGHPAVMVIM